MADKNAKRNTTDDIKLVFNRFDANGDGKISSSELGSLLRALGSDAAPDEIKRIMSEIDTDGDGYIDINEFAEFYSCGDDDCSSGAESKELREAFDMYDRDKNGLISASELHAVLKTLGEKCSLQDCRRMISNVDTDGDGNVNFEEFKKMMAGG
ncbi:EF-hand domain [Dillenia turbinata]|uniref:EF-hand domain n=1 Tax=Dillenia turbinata TaxID=194707 RepID=A0AAN8UGF3_9MAGN